MSYSILIVDDMPDEAAEIGKLVTALLDCRVEYAADRFEGWSKLESGTFDAVVLDLYLGGLHEGRLFLEMLRSRMPIPPGTIIISHSGNEPTARELKGRFAFISEVVAKSDIHMLTEVIKRALEDAVGPAKGESPDAKPAPPSKEEQRSRLASRAVIVAAIIGAIGAIIAALIHWIGN